MDQQIFKALGIALLLGLLVGLQREWGKHRLAGIRTFTLITLFGAASTLLARDFGGLVVAASLVAVVGLLITGNWMAESSGNPPQAGQTTEMAALVMFIVGAMLMAGYTLPAVVLGGATAVLLHLKERLQTAVGKLSDTDVRAVFQFVLLALVILPLLPNSTYGPYDVLNPFKVWLMVVLIVAISLSGYLAYRMVGVRGGTVLAGILGGFIASTATTVSYARQCAVNPKVIGTASVVIVIASTIVVIRVAIEIGVVAGGLLSSLLPPFAAFFVFMVAASALLYHRMKLAATEPPMHSNPSQLTPAIIFGLLYAVMLMVVAFFEDYFGDQAIYVAAAISGLTGVDALTLSVAELYNLGRIEDGTAWRSIMIATMANLTFKAVAAGALGGRKLFVAVSTVFAATIAVGVAIVMLWP